VDAAGAVDAQNAPTAPSSLKRRYESTSCSRCRRSLWFPPEAAEQDPLKRRARAGGRSHVGSIHARYVTLLFALLNGTQQVPAHDGYASITGGAFLDTALTSSHPLCRAYRFA
jgi:hypothetical protein